MCYRNGKYTVRASFSPWSFTGWGSERVMGVYECVYVFYIALRYCIIITLLYCIMSGA